MIVFQCKQLIIKMRPLVFSLFTVSPELLIQVSDRAHGTHGFNEWLTAYHGKSLKPPQRPNFYPEPAFVQWHVREVFQGESR